MVWLGSIKIIFQREKEIALKVLKYSARMLCRVGMNIYKNNGALGRCQPRLRSFRLREVTSHVLGGPRMGSVPPLGGQPGSP